MKKTLYLNKKIIESGAKQFDKTYGPNIKLVYTYFTKNLSNKDYLVVATKIALIEMVYGTNLNMHKKVFSLCDLSNRITKIRDIDRRLKRGDSQIVKEIATLFDGINLFSFATKYCHNHNIRCYSIYDGVLKKNLPRYISGISSSDIEKWRKDCNYDAYNKCINVYLDTLHIHSNDRKVKFDHYIWYKHRNKCNFLKKIKNFMQ